MIYSLIDGLVPYDGVPIEEDVTVSVILTTVFTLLAIAGIIFTVVCIAFNVVFREKKQVALNNASTQCLIIMHLLTIQASTSYKP